jgi:hypothetical protein
MAQPRIPDSHLADQRLQRAVANPKGVLANGPEERGAKPKAHAGRTLRGAHREVPDHADVELTDVRDGRDADHDLAPFRHEHVPVELAEDPAVAFHHGFAEIAAADQLSRGERTLQETVRARERLVGRVAYFANPQWCRPLTSLHARRPQTIS